MPTWIAFFRGINVGGKNVLPMRELVSLLEQRGCVDIRTYIQSGNVVFQSSESKSESLSRRIASTIARECGFDPAVMILSEKELAVAVSGNPFRKAEADPKSLHLYFLASKPKRSDVSKLNELKSENESFAVKDAVLYLHTPDGFGKSKLAGNVERLLGVAATARNWRTVTKMCELVDDTD